ncbi:sulfate adenylyltransferase subunit 1 [Candidatus Omnitrophota bacterium]
MKEDAIKIVIVGHVDHGKSTLIGRLLLDTDSLPKEKMSEIEKISTELGKSTELAYVTDQLKEERERNITIDTTQIFFKTRKRNYVIVDAPGHVEFIKNMMSGASLTNAAVLIVDAHEGVMEQTRRHLYIINLLGIDKIIVVLNKMDLVGYDEKKFEKVKAELERLFETLGIKTSFMLPVSAREGTNISKASPELDWYKGPSLLEALDSLQLNANREVKPLRLPVQDIYEINNEKIIVGRIESGTIKQNQDIVLLPSLKSATVDSIKIFEAHEIKEAKEGESIGVTLKESLLVERGEVIVQKEKLPQLNNRFSGNIFWMSSSPLEINKSFTLRCSTQEITCVAEKIYQRTDTTTFEIIEENSDKLGLNEAGLVQFKTKKPIVVEKFSYIQELGRFVIEDKSNLQGVGIIRGALKSEGS